MSERELGFNNEPNQDPENKKDKDARENELRPDQLRQICEQTIAELDKFDLKSQSLKVSSMWEENSSKHSVLENYDNFMFQIVRDFGRYEKDVMGLIGVKLYFKIITLYEDFCSPHLKSVPFNDPQRVASHIDVFMNIEELNEMPEYANNVKEYIENLKVLINEAITNLESQ
jgi:hypothetical protein